MKYAATSVRSYLQALPPERRAAVRMLIRRIKKAAPTVKEIYKYGVCFYPLNGKPLFAVASQKHFTSLYVTERDVILRYATRLGRVSLGKSCIRIRALDRVNLDIVEKLLRESYKNRMQKITAAKVKS